MTTADRWPERSLYDLATYQNGRPFGQRELGDAGPPILKIAELTGGITRATRRFPGDVEERHRVRHGDLLFAWSGSVGIHVWEGPDAYLNQHIFKVSAAPGIDQTFLRYVLAAQLPTFRRIVADQTTTMGHVKVADLKRLKVRVPPLAEQRSIARTLSAFDEERSALRKRCVLLDRLSHELFESWFVAFDPSRTSGSRRGVPAGLAPLFPERMDGGRPEGWLQAPLSELCASQYGFTVSAATVPSGPRLLRVTDINKNNWIDWSAVPTCEVDEAHRKRYALKPGDIVVARMADPGKSAIVDEPVDAVFASYLVRLTVRTPADAQFVFGYLKSSAFDRYSTGAIGGSVQQNMNAQVITRAPVVTPPPALRAAYGELVAPFRLRIACAVREVSALKEIGAQALAGLIDGTITPDFLRA